MYWHAFICLKRLLLLVLFLAACSPVREDEALFLKGSSQVLNNAIADSKRVARRPNKPYLSPEVMIDLTEREVASPASYFQSKVDVSVSDMPITQFLNSLMIGTKESIVVSPGIEGMVNLNLKQVTISEVLGILEKLYSITYRQTRYGYIVAPKKLETKVFSLNLIHMIRSSNNSTTINNIGISAKAGSKRTGESSNVVTKTSNALLWDRIKTTIEQLIGRDVDSSVAINPHTGVVTVTAMPDTMLTVDKFIQETETIANREVHIEAKIIELELNHEFKTGVNWSLLNIDYQGGLGMFKKSSDNPSFDEVIQLLSKEGRVSVLSNPRVSTLNNQQAVIKVGGDRYFLTNIRTTNTPVGNTSQQQSDIQLEPFFSGLSLQVLPQIRPDNQIKLFIHPVISTVTDDSREIKISQQQVLNLPLARSVIRETDSVVKAKNKQIIILGGLMQARGSEDNATIPVLDHMKVYPNNTQSSSVIELIILLKAWVVNDDNITDTLETLARRYESLAYRVKRRS